MDLIQFHTLDKKLQNESLVVVVATVGVAVATVEVAVATVVVAVATVGVVGAIVGVAVVEVAVATVGVAAVVVERVDFVVAGQFVGHRVVFALGRLVEVNSVLFVLPRMKQILQGIRYHHRRYLLPCAVELPLLNLCPWLQLILQ